MVCVDVGQLNINYQHYLNGETGISICIANILSVEVRWTHLIFCATLSISDVLSNNLLHFLSEHWIVS